MPAPTPSPREQREPHMDPMSAIIPSPTPISPPTLPLNLNHTSFEPEIEMAEEVNGEIELG